MRRRHRWQLEVPAPSQVSIGSGWTATWSSMTTSPL
jgi:hypothetical protein